MVGSTPTRFRQSLVDSAALVGARRQKRGRFVGVLDPSWPQILGFALPKNELETQQGERHAQRAVNDPSEPWNRA